ncbi:HEXXH motif domain-containing protein [Spirillospora sp. CA-142024]|uniref:HEXXH motif domain-containing protein n=1 Tax=Spirillospora sp. CA-142024 TaxID=3240036 RepID=UPI003D8DDF6C
MMRNHEIPLAHFEALAAGDGDDSTVRLLWKAEYSTQLLRLRALLDSGPSLDRDAYDLLAAAQARAPRQVEELMLYPHVTAWSAACLRRLREGGAAARADLAHFANVAVAAAIRSGLTFTATAVVRDGMVNLPSLGRAEVARPGHDGTAAVRCDGGEAEVSAGDRRVALPADPHADAPGWRGVHRLRVSHAGRALDVHLDDLDPYRDNHRLGPAGRLDAAAAEGWRRTLDGAWSFLVRNDPGRVAAMTAGLNALVPLTTRGGRRGLSATSADALGAVAITQPEDALLFAESLVHEFQHVKLCSLLDRVPLYADRHGERHYSPWRNDPRPIGGLLHGAYAYLGVTGFWGRQLEALTGGDAAYGEYAFALSRDQTSYAIRRLEASGRLTGAGERFVEGMRTALDRWTDVPLAPEARRQARSSAADHALVWRLRNLRPDPEEVRPVAGRWRSEPPGALHKAPVLRPADVRPGVPDTRADLRCLSLRDPAAFARLCEREGAGASAELTAGLAQVRERHDAALASYRALIAAEPARPEHWAGLVLSLRGSGGHAAQPLSEFPEIVAAVYRHIVQDQADAPDPVELAEWLAPALQSVRATGTSEWGRRDIAVE